jgi:hypothetical protein
MDEKIFEQGEKTQEPSPGGGEDVEQQRAEIREAENHGEEHNPPEDMPSTGSRGSWS